MLFATLQEVVHERHMVSSASRLRLPGWHGIILGIRMHHVVCLWFRANNLGKLRVLLVDLHERKAHAGDSCCFGRIQVRCARPQVSRLSRDHAGLNEYPGSQYPR